MTIHYPESKLENAIKHVYQNNESNTLDNIYTTWNDEQPILPCLTIVTPKSSPEIIGDTLTGNWTCMVDISVITHIEDTDAQTHINYEAMFRDIIFSDGLKEEINTASQELDDEILIMVLTPTDFERTIEDGKRISKQTVEVYLMPYVD